MLLLTNDGEIARRLEIPAAGWVRKYRARLFGKVTQADLDKLATGITIDGVKYGPIVADIERSKGMYSWATVSLKEGKNREVKRVMERLGLKVARLIRIAYGPFQLGQLAEGQVEEIPARLWREQLGIGRKKRLTAMTTMGTERSLIEARPRARKLWPRPRPDRAHEKQEAQAAAGLCRRNQGCAFRGNLRGAGAGAGPQQAAQGAAAVPQPDAAEAWLHSAEGKETVAEILESYQGK